MKRRCEHCGGALHKGNLYCSPRCAGLGREGEQRTIYTERQRRLFRAFWEAGMPFGEISERTGICKNGIASLRRRMGLIPRGSPLGRSDRILPPDWRSRPKKPRDPAAPPTFAERPPLPPQVAVLPPDPPPPPPTQGAGRTVPCTFPLSDGRPWRFCDAPADAGGRYCAAHTKLCRGRQLARAA